MVLVIGSLGLGLGVTLWLSTDAAERSYQLGSARETNQALLQQKEALERDVLEAQAAPALAESARELGMIPSRDTAHLVQDPAGNWIVVGTPKPAEGVPPPPLNTPLPDEHPRRRHRPPRRAAPAPPAIADPSRDGRPSARHAVPAARRRTAAPASLPAPDPAAVPLAVPLPDSPHGQRSSRPRRCRLTNRWPRRCQGAAGGTEPRPAPAEQFAVPRARRPT